MRQIALATVALALTGCVSTGDIELLHRTRLVPLPFEAGEIDLFDCDFAMSQIPYFTSHAKWGKQTVSGPRVGLYYYSINQAIKPFDNVKVRQAFQMAVDVPFITLESRDAVLSGVPPECRALHMQRRA